MQSEPQNDDHHNMGISKTAGRMCRTKKCDAFFYALCLKCKTKTNKRIPRGAPRVFDLVQRLPCSCDIMVQIP